MLHAKHVHQPLHYVSGPVPIFLKDNYFIHSVWINFNKVTSMKENLKLKFPYGAINNPIDLLVIWSQIIFGTILSSKKILSKLEHRMTKCLVGILPSILVREFEIFSPCRVKIKYQSPSREHKEMQQEPYMDLSQIPWYYGPLNTTGCGPGDPLHH